MRYISILFALLLWSVSVPAAPLSGCGDHLPFGAPVVANAKLSSVCHAGYAAGIDAKALVPRWVAYQLTAEHVIGCGKREDDFHADDKLPVADRASPADYERSGYDKGHMAPAEDFAWNATQMSDSFSMANMAPQLPGLNRKQWEHLEETVRAWAFARGALIVYVGPIIGAAADTIGHDRVAIPRAFWKVIIDPNQREALAFIMPQREIAKGDLKPWETSIDEVERHAGIVLPLPAGIDRSAQPVLWQASLTGLRAEKKRICR